MSVPSPEAAAALAIRLAHECYSGGCIDCGAHGVEMHEILGRTMRKTLGAAVCILGVTLAPLCAMCHRKWEKMSVSEQVKMLGYMCHVDADEDIEYHFRSEQLANAQRDQLIALKARIGFAR